MYAILVGNKVLLTYLLTYKPPKFKIFSKSFRRKHGGEIIAKYMNFDKKK